MKFKKKNRKIKKLKAKLKEVIILDRYVKSKNENLRRLNILL